MKRKKIIAIITLILIIIIAFFIYKNVTIEKNENKMETERRMMEE